MLLCHAHARLSQYHIRSVSRRLVIGLVAKQMRAAVVILHRRRSFCHVLTDGKLAMCMDKHLLILLVDAEQKALSYGLCMDRPSHTALLVPKAMKKNCNFYPLTGTLNMEKR